MFLCFQDVSSVSSVATHGFAEIEQAA